MIKLSVIEDDIRLESIIIIIIYFVFVAIRYFQDKRDEILVHGSVV